MLPAVSILTLENLVTVAYPISITSSIIKSRAIFFGIRELFDHSTLSAHFLIRLFRSATDFEGGAYRLLGGAGEAEGAASPSKREHRRQMAEALLGAEPDAQGYSISSCFTFIDEAEKAFTLMFEESFSQSF